MRKKDGFERSDSLELIKLIEHSSDTYQKITFRKIQLILMNRIIEIHQHSTATCVWEGRLEWTDSLEWTELSNATKSEERWGESVCYY